jgi:hypothetical protein
MGNFLPCFYTREREDEDALPLQKEVATASTTTEEPTFVNHRIYAVNEKFHGRPLFAHAQTHKQN